MDTPLSENRSNNLLVYVAAGAAVVALLLGIISLIQINKVKEQLGTVNLVELSQKITEAETRAAASSTEARGAKNDVRTLQALMERELGAQLSDIRNNIARVEDLAKQASSRPAVASAAPSNEGAGAAANDGQSPAAPQGQLDADGSYVIKSGDNFGRIAAQFGVRVADVIAANPGVDPRRLQVGQRIQIPQR